MEDELWCIPPLKDDTFHGTLSLKEHELRWKTTFDGRQPMMETEFDGRGLIMGRQPLMEDDL